MKMAFAALAVVACVGLGANTAATNLTKAYEQRQAAASTPAGEMLERDYWSLIRIDAKGREFVVDWDLAWDDCINAISTADPRFAWSCERQPLDTPIGGK